MVMISMSRMSRDNGGVFADEEGNGQFSMSANSVVGCSQTGEKRDSVRRHVSVSHRVETVAGSVRVHGVNNPLSQEVEATDRRAAHFDVRMTLEIPNAAGLGNAIHIGRVGAINNRRGTFAFMYQVVGQCLSTALLWKVNLADPWLGAKTSITSMASEMITDQRTWNSGSRSNHQVRGNMNNSIARPVHALRTSGVFTLA